MAGAGSFVVLQLLLTIFLLALLWSLHERLRQVELFRWRAWAWISFVVFLAGGTLAVALPRESQPELLLLDIVSTLGICLALVLMLLDRYQQAERALLESTRQGRKVTAENVALQAEIDERQKAEQALRESESRYRAVVEDQSELICRFRPDATITFANQAYCRYFGRTREELIGRNFMELIPGVDHDLARQHLASFTPDRPLAVVEHRVTLPDGEVRWQQWTDRAIFDQEGRLEEFQSVGRDISERRRAEEALRASEVRYQLATAAAGVGVWDLDLETGEMYIDPQLKAILGFEDHEIRNHRDDWFPRVHPGDLERMKADADAHRRGATSLYEDEHRMLHKDGSIRWFLARGRVVDAPGEHRRLVGTDTDVTARKEAADALRDVQARHHAILRAIPDLMFVLDTEGVYIDYHARDQDALLIPPEQFIGRNLREIFPPELAGRMARCLEDVVRSGEPSTLEYDLPLDGAITHWEARVVRCDTDKVLSIVRDVTDRKRAERETRELRDELTHVGRVSSLGALTGSLAHEINQPLASIMANAQAALRLIALSPPDLDELREALADIVDDDRRAGNVLRRLRALLTNAAPETVPLDIKDTLEEIRGLLHSDSVMRGISLEVRLAEDLPPVRGDRIQLQQVALNLLINAFDAVQDLDADRRRVTLEAGVQEEQVVVSVADHGPGVPEDRLLEIFDPFYTTKAEGMGMGLSICQTIANAHGGVVVAARNSDRGMTFALRLPIAHAIAPGAAASHPARAVTGRYP